MSVDLIAVGGEVLTMETVDAVAQAFAVKDGRIAAVGTNEEIERLAGPDTRRLDLKGRLVTPGLIDTHIHVASLGSIGAGAGLAFVGTDRVADVSDVDSIDGIVDVVRERARDLPDGEWVVTGWPAGLPQGVLPTRWDLDRAAPDKPVMISGYPYVVVNSLLLEQAGITRETQSPAGGEILRDERGEPNGALSFQAVYQLLPTPPQPSVEETEAAIKRVHDAFLAEGLTAYKDAGVRENAIEAYRRLRRNDEMKCRTHLMYTWLWSKEDALHAVEVVKQEGDEVLSTGSVKLSLDGGIPSRTAWSYEDWHRDYYEVVEGSRGYWKIEPGELDEMVEILNEHGLQISCHCEGDRAIDTYLAAIEKALEKHPRTSARHTVIHCNLPTDEAIEKMRSLGDNIAIEPQAIWMGDDRFASGCGPERSKRHMPFNTWLRAGLTVGNGCDFPPEPFPPRLGIWSSCTREAIPGKYGRYPYGTEECITVEEAIHTYTMGGAKCLHWEKDLGSLEPGKCADFVVWDRDLRSIPGTELKDARVELTAVGGEILFERDVTAERVPAEGGA